MVKKSVKKTTRPSRRPVYIILALSLIFALGFALWKSTRPAPIQIMAIDPVPLTYGDTTLTGTIQKDSPVGEEGNFILVLSDMRTIVLNVSGLDHLIGLEATVNGYLSTPTNILPLMTMRVDSITIAQE